VIAIATTRFIAAMVCVLAVVTVAGCGGEEQTVKTVAETEAETVTVTVTETEAAEATPPPAPPPPATPPASTEDALASVGDAIVLRGNDENLVVRVKVLSVRDPAPSANEFFGPAQGKRWVAFRVRLVNVGDLVYDDSPSNGVRVVDTADQEYTTTIGGVEPQLGSTTIRPGDARVGWLTFEVPKGTKLRLFQFTLDSGFGPETGEWNLA
jgi:hypothetical protein